MTNLVIGKSYFIHEQNNGKHFDYLSKNERCDIAIVGAGVTGAIVGYFLSQMGMKVVLLDKGRVGHTSTSITTSLLQYELDRTIEKLKSEGIPIENSIDTYELNLKALSWLESYAKKNTFLYKKRDSFFYTTKSEKVEEITREFELRKNANLPVRLYREIQGMPELKRGICAESGGAELHPMLFTEQLLCDIVADGVSKVYANTEVKDVDYGEQEVVLTTVHDYEVIAKHVIIATGYNTEMFSKKKWGEAYLTHNIVTTPFTPDKLWERKMLLRDAEDPYTYIRTTSDNRVIIGGKDVPFTDTITDSDRQNCYEKLVSELRNLFPHLDDFHVDYSYSGKFISTHDDRGYIGVDEKHPLLHWCLGYGANGIVYAILGGMYFQSFFSGEKNEDCSKIARLFAPSRI
ncbi:MAG: NAD(P)/FAD-dependent oxidoreductase [Bacilli bacterium]